MKLLNLACGHRHHPDWVNVDLVVTGEDVLQHDLTRGIPFADAAFDAVYTSHFVEHLSRPEAFAVLNECRRVLRPGGVIRVVVPDLEGLVRAYLGTLEKARQGSRLAAANYDWLLLEMFDQVGREKSGGGMAAYLRRDYAPNKDFVRQRIGSDADVELSPECDKDMPVSGQLPSREAGRVYRWAQNLLRPPSWFREAVKKRVLGAEYEALQVGRFRRSGEVHRTMYDSYSLGILLDQSGFSQVRSLRYDESKIPGWKQFGLDADADGSRAADASLYIEADKPGTEHESDAL